MTLDVFVKAHDEALEGALSVLQVSRPASPSPCLPRPIPSAHPPSPVLAAFSLVPVLFPSANPPTPPRPASSSLVLVLVPSPPGEISVLQMGHISHLKELFADQLRSEYTKTESLADQLEEYRRFERLATLVNTMLRDALHSIAVDAIEAYLQRLPPLHQSALDAAEAVSTIDATKASREGGEEAKRGGSHAQGSSSHAHAHAHAHRGRGRQHSREGGHVGGGHTAAEGGSKGGAKGASAASKSLPWPEGREALQEALDHALGRQEALISLELVLPPAAPESMAGAGASRPAGKSPPPPSAAAALPVLTPTADEIRDALMGCLDRLVAAVARQQGLRSTNLPRPSSTTGRISIAGLEKGERWRRPLPRVACPTVPRPVPRAPRQVSVPRVPVCIHRRASRSQ